MRVDDAVRDRVRERFGRMLGKFALHIERGTVRFEDMNGPRGGVDVSCRIKIVLSNLPSVLLEERGETVTEAFGRAVNGVERAVRRNLGRADMKTPEAGRKAQPKAKAGAAPSARRAQPEGSLVGGRAGAVACKALGRRRSPGKAPT